MSNFNESFAFTFNRQNKSLNENFSVTDYGECINIRDMLEKIFDACEAAGYVISDKLRESL